MNRMDTITKNPAYKLENILVMKKLISIPSLPEIIVQQSHGGNGKIEEQPFVQYKQPFSPVLLILANAL